MTSKPNLLTGIYARQASQFWLDDQSLHVRNPRHAMEPGLIIQQNLTLANPSPVLRIAGWTVNSGQGPFTARQCNSLTTDASPLLLKGVPN